MNVLTMTAVTSRSFGTQDGNLIEEKETYHIHPYTERKGFDQMYGILDEDYEHVVTVLFRSLCVIFGEEEIFTKVLLGELEPNVNHA